MQNQKFHNKQNTSWQKVAPWYNKLVGNKGQYYHDKVIIPSVLRMLNVTKNNKLLDLACGQGILERSLPKEINYFGVDLSADLIKFARRNSIYSNHKFEVGDITKNLQLNDYNFDICTIILALQNVKEYRSVFENAKKYLRKNGCFLIVINHPYFRIPRQTGWGIDEGNKKQFRKIYEYISSSSISIDMTPGGAKRTYTWSFHEPLQNYIKALNKVGFVIEDLEEWISDKESVGKAAKMENKSRKEIPMFMAIKCRLIG